MGMKENKKRSHRRVEEKGSWYEENKEKEKLRMANYRKDNKEKIKARMSKWRKDNAQKIIKYRETNRKRDRNKEKEWYLKNKEKHAGWAKANPEKVKASYAAWVKAHPERRKTLQADWRKANLQKARAYSTTWHKAHPEKARLDSHAHRARKAAVGGKLSKGISEKLLLQQKGKCAICKKSVKKTGYHLDHIMPLALSGKNEDGNIQITCPTCNLQKNSKHPIAHMQSLGYLL